MKKFPLLYATTMALLDVFLNILNKILTIVYLLLPVGLFMLVMQLRDKNNKATAINTFITDNSEFQFIFPEYILVSNKPNNLKTNTKNKLVKLNTFCDKWKGLFITLILICIIITIIISLCF